MVAILQMDTIPDSIDPSFSEDTGAGMREKVRKTTTEAMEEAKKAKAK